MPDILLVEDERVVREATLRACDSAGLRLEDTRHVEEAIARLRQDPFRLALVDLMLPGRSGFELLDWARLERPAMPVVVISGYATIENTLKSFALGAFDFIPKPFDVDELLGVVRRGLLYGEADSEPEGAAESTRAATGSPLLFLGRHSWAQLDADGTSTLGVAETFPATLGEVTPVDMPESGQQMVQAKRLLSIRDSEGLDHRVWSPLSGRVIESNRRIATDPDLIHRDRFGSGWLVRIIPAHLETELPALTRRGADAAPSMRR